MKRDMFDDPRSREADELSLAAERLERTGDLNGARPLFARAATLEQALARETPTSSPRVRGVLAISAVSLWHAAGAHGHAADLTAEFMADPTLLTADRDRLAALARATHDPATRRAG
jgi:hypothetical protein